MPGKKDPKTPLQIYETKDQASQYWVGEPSNFIKFRVTS